MNKHYFIKVTADDNGELIKITLNTSNIYHYVAQEEDSIKNGTETKCCITVSSHKGVGSNFLYVMETKEYLDKILT